MTPPNGSARHYVTASEVGNFAYCPESWYLERFGVAPDGDGIQRLRDGSSAHKRIGRATDHLASTEVLRSTILIGLIVVALLLLSQAVGVQVPR